MKKDWITKLFILYIFFYLLWGAHAWITWFLDDEAFSTNIRLIVILGGFLVSCSYLYENKIKLNFDTTTILAGIIFIVSNAISSKSSLLGVGVILLQYFPLWVLLSDKKNAKFALDSICYLIACVLLAGIIMHIILFVVGRFPTIPIHYPGVSPYYFQNYFVILKGITYESEGIRFHSIFLESGYMATMLSFLLYAVKYDFKKKRNIIIAISIVLSFSLAGYVTSLIGYVLFLYSQKKSFKKQAILACGLCILYIGITNYNDGNNLLKELILDRLQYDQDKGILGNNRTGEAGDFYFEKAIADGSFLWGLGGERISRINGGRGWQEMVDYENQIRGAGVKIFILYHGIFITILFLFSFFLLSFSQRYSNRKHVYGFFMLILLTFMQAAYPTSFSCWVPYILACSIEMNEKRRKVISQKTAGGEIIL